MKSRGNGSNVSPIQLVVAYVLLISVGLVLILANALLRATDPGAFALGVSQLLQALTIFVAVFVVYTGPPSVLATTARLRDAIQDGSMAVQPRLVAATICELTGALVGLAGLLGIVFFGSWVAIPKSSNQDLPSEGMLETAFGIDPILGIDGHVGLGLLVVAIFAYLLAWILR